MLEYVFSSGEAIARLRQGPLGEIVDDLAAYLCQRGHSLVTVQGYLRAVGHFSHWLGIRRISISALSGKQLHEFLRVHLHECRCPVPFGGPLAQLRAAPRHVMKFLQSSGRLPVGSAARPADALIAEFQTHLRLTRGASAPTCGPYCRYVREFLDRTGISSAVGLKRLEAREVMEFIAERATRCKPGTAKLVATALRGFLRFQALLGRCSSRLAEAVPTIPRRKLSRIPKTLTDDEIDTLMRSFDRTTAIGKRNYAMVQCMIGLALRVGEVAQLSVDDFNWRSGTVSVTMSKARRASLLPIPREVGCAIAAYLRHGRPPTAERRIFVRHSTPVGGAIDSSVIRAAVRRAFKRADLRVSSMGAHTLRHTAATKMIRSGATIKEVADVLRHRCLDTTMIYTKVDLPRLAAVALPFPRARP